MAEKIQNNWIKEMIKRQMTPMSLREGTINDFCKKYNIPSSNYYYYASKKENQEKIVKGSLMLAKEYTPDILEKLGEKAKAGDMKAIDMFLNYILKLSTNLDIKSDGERVGLFDYIKNKKDNESRRNDSNSQNS